MLCKEHPKFGLMEEYGLHGCGYWQVMEWFRANWLLLRDLFYIEKYRGQSYP